MSKLYDLNKVIQVALNEVGYLEKATNNMLDDKTANAGSNNFTKFGKRRGCNGQPWCDAFVDDCFVQAYGESIAKELLHGFSNYTPTSAEYFKKHLQWYTQPEDGDIIFFKNSTRICHTGIVYAVDKNRVLTIEGNTSDKQGLVPNGGCVAKKSYNLSYARIAGYGRPVYYEIDTKNPKLTPPTLQRGDVNVWVKELQEVLVNAGFKMGVDGDFGGKTYQALIAYQGLKGLVKDGICGPKTWATIK